MSVVIIGGNEGMEQRYLQVCKEYGCKAKIFTKSKGTMRDKLGEPDYIILFTRTVSHKMVNCAMKEAKQSAAEVVRCASSSVSALKQVLDQLSVAN